MRTGFEQILLYLLVSKIAIGGVSFYVSSRRHTLDWKTFLVIAFVPWLSILYVALKKKSMNEGMSIGLWIYIGITFVEMLIVSVLRTIPTP